MKKITCIIPYPRVLEERDGTFKIGGKIIYSADEKYITSPIKALFEKAGISLVCGEKENAALLIEKSSSYKDYSLEDDESYALEINEKICVYAASEKGVFYALQTLAQMLFSDNAELPNLFIFDKPEYSWRGFMLDTCRSFFTVDFIKKMLDLCAFHKLNVFHWHLTDDQGWRLPVKKYPLLTQIGSRRWGHTMPPAIEGVYEECKITRKFYTEEEIKDVVQYAAERFITVVPEVELPGHSSALLAAYPEFGCTGGPYNVENRWGIFPDVLCIGNDDIFSLYDEIFATVENLFPGKYLHIGGDECPSVRWQTCPRCLERVKKENLSDATKLQSWATSRFCELVEKHHKIPIGWDEVLNNCEEIPVPASLVIQSWQGFEGGEKAAEKHHMAIMSPQTNCYLNLKPYDSYEEPGRLGVTTVEKAYSFNPCADEKNKKYILGGEAAIWSEGINHSKIAEYLIFPRLSALSECFWLNDENKNFQRFEEGLKIHKETLHKLNVLFYNGDLK